MCIGSEDEVDCGGGFMRARSGLVLIGNVCIEFYLSGLILCSKCLF